MKTSRMAYVVVKTMRATGRTWDVQVFTNEHAAYMCARQYAGDAGRSAWVWTRNMNDGRVSLEGG